jgi:hypothetical protein
VLPTPALPRLAHVAAALALLALAAPATLRAQDDDDYDDHDRGGRTERGAFRWQGEVPAGGWLYLRNLNGPVRVERGSGAQVEVTADRTTNRGDPRSVRFEARRAADGRGMIVCALWYDGTCDEGGSHGGRNSDWGRNRDEVSVAFTVRVPAGVRLDVRTVNGGLDIRGAGAEVVARTTNGPVRAESSGGPVSARTTNGPVHARMGSVGDARDLEFTTTNGPVTVEMPDDLGAEVSMSTTNGSVSTEFPVTVQGRIDPRRMTVRLGDGSRRVRLRTTNGNVELRRTGTRGGR